MRLVGEKKYPDKKRQLPNNTHHSETVEFFSLIRCLSDSLLHKNVPGLPAKKTEQP